MSLWSVGITGSSSSSCGVGDSHQGSQWFGRRDLLCTLTPFNCCLRGPDGSRCALCLGNRLTRDLVLERLTLDWKEDELNPEHLPQAPGTSLPRSMPCCALCLGNRLTAQKLLTTRNPRLFSIGRRVDE